MTSTNIPLPRITVVTVVYNGEEFIERTILSVIGQTYQNIEYVIIDGDSLDQTTDIIRKYESKIHYWVSEKDFGIYDAMNKGIDVASGEWINFMNAGDVFSSSSTLSDIFSVDHNNTTILYGDVEVVYPTFSRLAKAGSIKKIAKGMPFSHQSSFVKTEYHRCNRFNIKNRIVADMEFFMSAFRSDIPFRHLPITVSSIIVGGVSDSNRLKTIVAWWRTSVLLGSSKLLSLHFITLIVNCIVREAMKKVLPSKVVIKMQNKL